MSATEKKFEVPVRLEAIAFLLLVSFSLILRLNQLSADPPLGISASHGVYTDPAQYVSFARNLLLWGSFSPLDDFRFIFFLKSAMTLLSLLIFKIGGVGYVQANIVALMFSFSTIVLLYFTLRKIAGSLAAIAFLIFITFDYNQIFYGRLPFLENSMNFFGILAFTILIYAQRAYAFVLAGMALAAGIFFGKLIGMIYLIPFVCYAAYDLYYDQRTAIIKGMLRYIYFAAGFLVVLIFWYFFSYRPATMAVAGYVQEQAIDLYGSPEALKYYDIFIYRYLSFGALSRLFPRMPVSGLLAWGMILILLFRLGFRESWKNKFFGLTPGVIFLIALVVTAYGSLMIWNYRPLRYQIILIYPICALAGVFVSIINSRVSTGLSRRGYIAFPLIFFLFVAIPVYLLIGPIYNLFDSPFHYINARGVIIAVTFAVTIIVTLLMRFGPMSVLSPPRWFKNFIIVGAVTLTVVPGAVKYLGWSSTATYHIVRNSKDLVTLVSSEAVISGPYAPVMTLENRLMNFIHMFGVSVVDPDFFKNNPVTHLLLDKSNLEIATKDYPELMEKAVSICKYRIGGRDVSLYRIAEFTGNPAAANYKLSPYEAAMAAYVNKDINSGNKFMEIYDRLNPENMSGNFVLAQLAEENGLYAAAERYLKKAIEFSPTDFYLHFRLGEFYIKMYNLTRDLTLKVKAEQEFGTALVYNPESRKLIRDIDEKLK
ncbi:MAG: hypothetical protein CVT49_01095 [candidate division Zixibacteria bacterium HGW-Zixibacteria-1]|nr:MAG: hypothetical protein CVT49_01095 [candidate division Zixibacteria bacterium HGW-Zixibacteria-1]